MAIKIKKPNMKKAIVLIIIIIAITSNFISQDGYSEKSKIHKKYNKHIVFSNKPIYSSNENPDDFVSEWKMGEPLYAKIYLEKPLFKYAEEFKAKHSTSFRDQQVIPYVVTVVKINGKEVSATEIMYDIDSKSYNTKTDIAYSGNSYVPGSTSGNVFGYSELRVPFSSFDSNIKPGNYKLEFHAYIACNEKWAGYVKDDDKAYRLSPQESLRDIEIYSGNLNVEVTDKSVDIYESYLCSDFSRFEGINNNKELEQEIMNAFDAWSENGEKSQKVVIASRDWEVSRNKYGVIENKWMSAIIGYKDAEGNCYKAAINFKKDYLGNRYTDKVKIAKKYYINRITCDCLE